MVLHGGMDDLATAQKEMARVADLQWTRVRLRTHKQNLTFGTPVWWSSQIGSVQPHLSRRGGRIS